MELLADGLLVLGTLSAGFYCFVLARRISRLNDLENGIGSAVAVLSAQVDDLTTALASSRSTATTSVNSLNDLTLRAEDVAQRLEIIMASLHDLPENIQEQPLGRNQYQSTVSAPNQQPMFTRHRALQDINPR